MRTAWQTTAPPPAQKSGCRLELDGFGPAELQRSNLQTDLPRIARNRQLTEKITALVQQIPTQHILECGDARHSRPLRPQSLQLDLPGIARDPNLTDMIVAAVRRVPTRHSLECGDATHPRALRPRSVHLVLTSPPDWSLKRYRDHPGQMGHITDFHAFLRQLDEVWCRCFDALVPGGRLVCVVGAT